MTWNPPDPADLVPDIDSTNAPDPDDVPPAETQADTPPDAHLESEYEDRFVIDADELPY